MSTASSVSNPAPDTVTVVVGGPLTGDSAMPGVTVNVFVLDAVPPGPVTATGPVEAPTGTVTTEPLARPPPGSSGASARQRPPDRCKR